jgi:outer membrane protein assembly factor BamB
MSVNAACINFHPPPAPIPPELAGSPPTELWNAETARGVTAPLGVTGSIVVAAAANRRLVAIGLDSARALWTSHLPGEAAGGVLTDGSRIYVGTGRPSGRIEAHGLNGRLLWRTSTGEITSPLARVGDMIVAMTRREQVVAVNAATGRLRWQRHAGNSRTAPIAADAGHVLVTTMDSLMLFETTAGRLVKHRHMRGVSLSGWMPVGRLLVTGLADSAVVAIDPTTLEEKWRVQTDAPVLGPVAVAEDTVWAATRIGTIYEIVAGATPAVRQLARLNWPLTSGIAAIGPDLLIGGADGTVRGLNRDGSEKWRVQLWPAVDIPPVPLPDGFAAIGGAGDLHRFAQ